MLLILIGPQVLKGTREMGFFVALLQTLKKEGRQKKKKGSGVRQNRNKCPFCLNGMTPGEDELSAHFAASNKFRRVWIGRRDITTLRKNLDIKIIFFSKYWSPSFIIIIIIIIIIDSPKFTTHMGPIPLPPKDSRGKWISHPSFLPTVGTPRSPLNRGYP